MPNQNLRNRRVLSLDFQFFPNPIFLCQRKNFCLRFWWNSKFEILMASGFQTWDLSRIGDKNFFDIVGGTLWIFQKIEAKIVFLEAKKQCQKSIEGKGMQRLHLFLKNQYFWSTFGIKSPKIIWRHIWTAPYTYYH